LATFIAMRLRGKHLPTYTPHIDCGDNVIVINAEKVAFTGKKFPDRVLRKAVQRMLPKESPLARKQLSNLRVYAGTDHPHEAQNPEVIDFKSMSSETQTLADLKNVMDGTAGGDAGAAVDNSVLPEPKIDEHGRAYATGKRKPVLRLIIRQAFEVSERVDSYDVVATVKGGGLSGQAGAVRHGITKALTYYEPALRRPLKAAGFITRDSRVVNGP